MINRKNFDVIIVGGSYAGLAAAMALGRALRNVLIIDSGEPCNRQTPASHNFLTQDGKPPGEIAAIGREQVLRYKTVEFLKGLVVRAIGTDAGFEVTTESNHTFSAKKLIFATGIKDIMPDIEGFAACWGISILHCPYCHGYEVRDLPTGVVGNGDYGYEFSSLIANWTKDLTLFTNGPSTLTQQQTSTIKSHSIPIVEKEIESFEHIDGLLQRVNFKDGTTSFMKALYTRTPFTQHCTVPEALGCALSDDGYISVDGTQKTTVPGVYACGDNTTRIRTVANAVAMGTTTGIMVNKELTGDNF